MLLVIYVPMDVREDPVVLMRQLLIQIALPAGITIALVVACTSIIPMCLVCMAATSLLVAEENVGENAEQESV